jgi:TonB family protein
MRSMKLYWMFLILVAFETGLVASNLQEEPQVKKRVDPTYPAILRLSGIEGEVDVRAFVDEQGIVEKVESIKASNPNFVPAALEAAKQWEFLPATKDGKPIKAEVIIPFRFRLGEGAYKSRNEDPLTLEVIVQSLLHGEVSEGLKSQIGHEAYAVIGNRHEHLYSLIFDKSKRSLLVEGSDSKIEFSHLVVNDAKDAAFLVLKTLPAKGKSERYHTVVFMKSTDGEWRIEAWHTSS